MPVLLRYRPPTAELAMNEAHKPRVDGGESGAWDAGQEEFVQAHLRRIFLIVYRILGNVEDAQDVTQDVFIKALQRQDQLKDLEKAAHWLSRIASNAAIDHLRRRKRINWAELDEPLQNTLTAGADSVEQQMLRSERRGQLQEVLNQLTPRERAALVLRDVDDMPAEEVARVLNCGKATVRSHIANARSKFKRLMGGDQ
ncbi:MAG TPA: sigma-70 family RNA polymerase sigma factor [Bryobacteraceae bacterium]|nr:sigma-70 family RNA polymerase sigma factor [Bryobacteraceae bacterium]HPT28647.1 sigma-70 family RNA polymerase sigma factor [Bryobacteraceae bacterium]